MTPIDDRKDIGRSSFRQQILDYENEHPEWEALNKKFQDQKLKGFKCPHCSEKTMGYRFGSGSYRIECLSCRRFVEKRGRPDWTKEKPTTTFFDLD